jgi:hypothetical protein
MIYDKICSVCGDQFQCNGIGIYTNNCPSLSSKNGCYCTKCFVTLRGKTDYTFDILKKCANGIEKEEAIVIVYTI